MRNLILFTLSSILLISCSKAGGDEKNLLGKQADWTFKNNALLKDSVLTLSGKSAVAGYNKEYKNFELNLECKTASGSIGGIWIHSNTLAENAPSGGYEVLINNNIEPAEWRKTGSLSAVRNFAKRTTDNDQWFPIKIQVKGKQIKVFVNNVWVVDYTEPAKPFRTEKYKDRLFDKGYFAFVNYQDGEISFRNISVKKLGGDLQSDNPNDIDEQTDDIIRLQQENFPLIDTHIHLKGGFTQDMALALFRKWGITYGIAPNCGLGFPVGKDEDIYTFLDTMRHKPFLLPMQAEGREWLDLFSREAISKVDYRFTDALTWTDNKGRRQRIWIDEETFIDDKQQFMDMLVDRACTIISTEPIEIFVNPTFIPDRLMPEYDQLWTPERMQRIVDVCVKHNVAIEINNRYKIPSARLIKQAKSAGAKFTFGTNNLAPEEVGHMEYAIEMIKECDLKPADLFIPQSKNF